MRHLSYSLGMKEIGNREKGKGKRILLFALYFLLFTFYSLLSHTLAQPQSTLFPYEWNDRSIFAQNLTTESQGILRAVSRSTCLSPRVETL